MDDQDTLVVKFKFKLGDIVHLKSVLETYLSHGVEISGGNHKFAWVRDNRVVGTIVSRLAEECPGGVQLHYHVRLAFPSGQPIYPPPSISDFLEHELVLYDDTQLRLKMEELKKEK